MSDLKNRKNKKSSEKQKPKQEETNDEQLFGSTSDGERFPMPPLGDPFAVHLPHQWSLFEAAKYVTATSNFLLLLVPGLPDWLFIVLFFFWRLAYNGGLGYLLHIQSNGQKLTKLYKKWKKSNSVWFQRTNKWIESDMKNGFKCDDHPDAFNAWACYRAVVDIILANDLACYVVFCLRFFQIPQEFSWWIVLRYIVGTLLSMFALWGKTDAYRVVGSFAWYWGDFFFLVEQSLTFDRVFGIAPHPMYTLGYSFFYGAALICNSYAVFAVSLVAHVAQMVFLMLVENPHIEKTYNASIEAEDKTVIVARERGYIRKDLIVLKNFNPYRSSDAFMLLLLVFFGILASCTNLSLMFFVYVSVSTRLIHSFGMGLLLWRQSKADAWIQGAKASGLSASEAFDSWKRIYNMSMVMTHVSFFVVFWKIYSVSQAWNNLTLSTLGLVLVFLNVWCASEIYEVVGDFGWFYGDMFFTEVPNKLDYTGIYRFLNNPETVLGFAGYYGLAIAANSIPLAGMAIFSHLSHLAFVRFVEEPHVKRRYGKKRRPRAGVQGTVEEIVREAVESRPQVRAMVRTVTEKLNNPPDERLKIC